ncbi:hypothetical protein C1645_870502 [Glomus cerebriforme]|uniref:Transcription activator GCR1-like domain-containing protein n=1 Tax=Glomus cerebriforme TaxID=658196 RepID=A0A397TKH7_9GLOM|nr:hypothetical protein C1645_870502 [Glomus cerebriforme]
MSMGKITRNKTYNELRHNKLPATRPRGRPPGTRRGIIDLDSIPTSRNNNTQEQLPLPEVRLPTTQQPPPPPSNNDSSVSYEAGSSTTTTSTIITIKMTTITHTDANNNSTTTTTVTTDISPVTSNTISSDPATVSVETREMPPQIARFPPQITPINVENNNNNTINTDNTVNAVNNVNTADTADTANVANVDNVDNVSNTINSVNTETPVSANNSIQQQHLIDSLINSVSSLGRHTINTTNMVRTPSTVTINSNGTSSSPVLEMLDSSFVDSNTVASDTSCLMNRLSHSPMSNSPIISSSVLSRPKYYRLPELDTLGTVYDVWNEWNVGLGGNPSIIALLENYGTKWATENKETLLLRKKLIKEIQQRSVVIGVDEAINELERMKDGNALSWLSKKFGKKRTIPSNLSSARHHHHHHHHNHHHHHHAHA